MPFTFSNMIIINLKDNRINICITNFQLICKELYEIQNQNYHIHNPLN
jgi:hypothetical protein